MADHGCRRPQGNFEGRSILNLETPLTIDERARWLKLRVALAEAHYELERVLALRWSGAKA